MPPAPLAIVVPTRNSSSLLLRLVRSLQEQTWRDWRVILVDASTLPGERPFLEQLVRSDPRFSWVPQPDDGSGIYGAMNIGFHLLEPNEWVLFWGSDDWASTPRSLQEALSDPSVQVCDLLVCRGRYMRPEPKGALRLERATSFRWILSYRLSLFLGSTPPHQCTLIGPGARRLLDRYDDQFRIAADLDYFLNLARCRSCRVRTSSILLIDMAVGGVSGLEHRRRFHEVTVAYRKAFALFWFIPFLMRYFQRLATLFGLP
jgi:glycosyltransferase involved in cell wall biosynthesis